MKFKEKSLLENIVTVITWSVLLAVGGPIILAIAAILIGIILAILAIVFVIGLALIPFALVWYLTK